jgi:hypothetical protein
MTFPDAVKRIPALKDSYRPGLEALSAADKKRLSCRNPRRLRGSVNLDDAFRRSQPNSPRWDYAIGLRDHGGKDAVAYVEVHDASSPACVGEMLKKLGWLKTWLKRAGEPLRELPGRYFWVASGSVTFGRGTPQARRIAQHGLRFPTEHLVLDQISESRAGG